MRDFEEALLVLAHLLGRPQILLASYKNIRSIDMFKEFPLLAAIFELVYEYAEGFGGCIPEDVVLLDIEAVCREKGLNDSQMHGYRDVLTRLYSPRKWSDEFVQTVISEVWKEATVNKLTSTLGASYDPDEAEKSVIAAGQSLEKELFQKPKMQNPMADIEASLRAVKKNPLHVSFLDKILGGGAVPGEIYGFVIPSGCGKTTLGTQLFSLQVNSGNHCLYISGEQGMVGDISQRMYVQTVSQPRSVFEKGMHNVPSDIIRMLGEAKPKWGEYAHFVDMSQYTKINNFDVIFDPLDSLAAEGKVPRIVVLDWWGRLKSKLITGVMESGEPASEAELRRKSSSWLHAIKQKAEKYGTNIIVFHQLAGEAAARSEKHVASSHSAQEDRNFNNMFDFCFVTSKLDGESNLTLKSDKARTTARTEVRLHLDGPFCMFAEADCPDEGYSTNPTLTEGDIPAFEAHTVDPYE